MHSTPQIRALAARIASLEAESGARRGAEGGAETPSGARKASAEGAGAATWGIDMDVSQSSLHHSDNKSGAAERDTKPGRGNMEERIDKLEAEKTTSAEVFNKHIREYILLNKKITIERPGHVPTISEEGGWGGWFTSLVSTPPWHLPSTS
eukprot:1196110-Prorocentrum_minimum.AAC.3